MTLRTRTLLVVLSVVVTAVVATASVLAWNTRRAPSASRDRARQRAHGGGGGDRRRALRAGERRRDRPVTRHVAGDGGPALSGSIHLVPSSIRAGDITRVLREGYDVGRLNDGFHELIASLSPDCLLIDTHPGLNEETLLSITVSDVLVLVLRPDQQDYQGTAVTVEVARKLEVPRLLLVVNKVLASFDLDGVRRKVEASYKATVAAVRPLSEDMVRLASSGIFSRRHPDHPWSRGVQALTEQILA